MPRGIHAAFVTDLLPLARMEVAGPECGRGDGVHRSEWVRLYEATVGLPLRPGVLAARRTGHRVQGHVGDESSPRDFRSACTLLVWAQPVRRARCLQDLDRPGDRTDHD